MTLHIHRNVTDAGAGTHDQQHRAKFKHGATQGKYSAAAKKDGGCDQTYCSRGIPFDEPPGKWQPQERSNS
jgi:hypothetical protein